MSYRSSVKPLPCGHVRRLSSFAMKLRHLSALLIACTVLAAYRTSVNAGQAAAAPGCAAITAANTDDCVRLNEIQVLGTHNSYHMTPAPPMFAELGVRGRDIEYTHRPLVEQLSQLGIRKF